MATNSSKPKSSKVGTLRPDISRANRIKSMFEGDSEVSFQFVSKKGKECSKLIMSVDNAQKAAALRKLLPEKYEDISIPLEVVIKDVSTISSEDVKAAFKGNPHFKDYIEIVDPLSGQKFHVCIFKEEVIKFLNDNGGSLHGYEFRLMEDLAREAMNTFQLIFTTDDGLPYSPKGTEGLLAVKSKAKGAKK